ncbi:MAG TPA: BTAD domain-containing putative transcriptional regulator [Longimicrobiales bacterium]|nr:BTAD domain-containing putative transcriptional regulator [Longimicrobiales bacterium]
MITVKAFGALELSDDARGPMTAVLAQTKRSALLAYLVLAHHGGFCRRDTLLALFWPDLDQEGGRRALSQALTFLRRHLGSETLVTRGLDEVGAHSAHVRSDVHEFLEALAARDWDGALARYQGDLLAGLHVAGAAPFVDWVDRERERLRETAAGAAWKRAQALIGEGRLVEAERTAQRGLALVATDESAVREFIEALAVAGDRAAALRFFEKFAGMLAQELDVEPAPETRAVAQAIRDGRAASALDGGPPRGTGASVGQTGNAPPRPANVSLRAYELYMHGLFKLNEWNARDLDGAMAALEAAVSEAPSFAAARAAYADACNEKADLCGPLRDLREKAYVNTEAALLLDPGLAEAHVARGNVLWNQDNRFPHDAALLEFQRAAELKPNLSSVHDRLATVYAHIGLLDLALEEARLAVALDPMNYWARFRVGLALWAQQRYAEAAVELRALPQQVVPAIRGAMLAEALLYLGQAGEALHMLGELSDSHPRDPWVQATRALVLASIGDAVGAERDITGATEHLYLPTHAHHSEFSIGSTYAVLGRSDEAIHWLRRAADDGWPCYPRYAGDPLLKELRTDARFIVFLDELRCTWEAFGRKFDPTFPAASSGERH